VRQTPHIMAAPFNEPGNAMKRSHTVSATVAIALILGAAVFAFAWAPARAAIEPETLVRPVVRCPSCGWIESMSTTSANGAAVYDYVVRMADGSTRTFSESQLPRRLRERVTLIDGAI
jgi:hypothetical protein